MLAARDEDGRLLGCAAWIRPGSYPLPVRAQLKQPTGALNALYPRPRALAHGTRYIRAIERVHPKEPMWYLAMLVVDPAVQRGASVRLCRTT